MKTNPYLMSLAFCLLFVAARADEPVTIKLEGDGHKVHSANYDATVAADGNLIDVQINGKSFLYHDEKLPRGIYLYKNGVVPLTVKEKGPTQLVATSEVAEVTYTFAAEKIVVKVLSTTSDSLKFYVAFSPDITAVLPEGGEMFRPPAQKALTNPAFFRDGGKLTVKGKFNFFPWGDKQLPIGHIELAGEATTELTLIPAAASERETKAVEQLDKKQ